MHKKGLDSWSTQHALQFAVIKPNNADHKYVPSRWGRLLIFISDFINILDVDMQLCTSEPQKELQTFPRLPRAVSFLPYAFSLIKRTGTNALTKHRKGMCTVCFKGRKRLCYEKITANNCK